MTALWLAGLGGVVGTLLALAGAGGGAIAVPLLVLVAGMSVQQASPVSLLAVGLSALVGAALGLRRRIVRWRAALLLGAAGLAAAPLGVWLAQRAPQALLLALFAAFLLLTAWRMAGTGAGGVRRAAQPACVRPDGAERLRWNRACACVLTRVGALTGLVSGLLGVGGGFIIVPALDRHSNLDLRSIQATSLFVIAIVAAGGLAAAAWHGQLRSGAALPFAAGTVAGLLLGRQVGDRLSPLALRRGFAAACVAMALLVLARAAGLLA